MEQTVCNDTNAEGIRCYNRLEWSGITESFLKFLLHFTCAMWCFFAYCIFFQWALQLVYYKKDLCLVYTKFIILECVLLLLTTAISWTVSIKPEFCKFWYILWSILIIWSFLALTLVRFFISFRATSFYILSTSSNSRIKPFPHARSYLREKKYK